MRLNQKLGLLFKISMVELGIIALIGVVFYFQFDNAKKEFVARTKAIAETIGDQATSFYQDHGEGSTSDEFYLFLDERLGREKLFNTFGVSPKFFSVTFTKQGEDKWLPGTSWKTPILPRDTRLRSTPGKFQFLFHSLLPKPKGRSA